ncbi:hypothetical protein T458_09355 [Brevibacillus panacihumi W25]|uniref:Uncharacterized protein n=1 Tax=Brevibacillus panacihumi W25 TaxID=1408254 RepID=V6MI22_9BACL|nr:hypothetical protein T458_09355 [Brevibacillus panacihumi W25]
MRKWNVAIWSSFPLPADTQREARICVEYIPRQEWWVKETAAYNFIELFQAVLPVIGTSEA